MLEIDKYKTSERMRLYLERVYPRTIEKSNYRKLESPRLGVVGKKAGGIDNSAIDYVDELIENNKIKNAIEQCVDDLLPDQSKIISLYYFDGYSDVQIKDRFKISNGTYYRKKEKALVNLAIGFVGITGTENILIYRKIAV